MNFKFQISNFKFSRKVKPRFIGHLSINFFIFLAIFHLSFFIFHFNTAYASEFSLSVYPPVIRTIIISGETVTIPITVTNHGPSSYFSTKLRSFTPSQDIEGITYSENETIPFFQQVVIKEDDKIIQNLYLDQDQTKTLTITITTTPEETTSDYYFSILFTTKDINYSFAAASQIVGGIALPVLVSVGQQTKPQAFLETFTTPRFFTRGPIPFTIKFKNAGQQLVMPIGTITISNIFGQALDTIELRSLPILSHTTRFLTNSSTNDTKAYWSQETLFGWYKATLTLKACEKCIVFTRSTWFIVFPLQILVGLFLALVFFFFLASRIKRFHG